MGRGVGVIEEIAAQKDRLFLWIPVAFGAGIALYFGLGREPGIWAGAVAALLSMPVMAWLHQRQYQSVYWFLGFVLSVAVFTAACGFEAAQISTRMKGTPILEKAIGPVDIEGRVASVEKLGGKNGSRAVLEDVVIERLSQQGTPRKVRLKFKEDEGLKAGQRISALVRIDAPSWPVAPGAYDFRRHLFFDGIGAVGFSYTPPKILDAPVTGGVSLFFEELRATIDGKIAERAGVVSAGIMSALITGQRGAIADTDDDAMRDSGLYHLLSISGTHVTMVAAVLFFFARFLMAAVPWVALHWPIKKIAAMVALCGAAFYVVLAGADVPAQRSLFMTGLIMVAIMLDRSPFSLRLIAFAALIVLLMAPYSLIGVSFQMSFAAVAALICFFDYIRGWWMRWRRSAGVVRKSILYLIGVMMTSLIAGTITGLFSLYHFQTFAVYGVISNMIVVPLTGVVIMPAAVVAMILMPFGLEGVALDAMEWGTLWMLGVAHWTAGLDGAVIHVTQWPVATYACIVVGTVLLLVWQGWRGKGAALAIVLIGLCLPFFSVVPDVMVSGTGKLVAVRSEEGGLYFSSGRKEKFAAENWLRLSGKEDEKPKKFTDEGSPVICDDAGCRAELSGGKVSLVRNRKAFYEDCDWADLIVAEEPLPRKGCGGNAVVLDLYDFLDNGAHAVYLSERGLRVVSVKSGIGSRPWTGGRKARGER